jgi:single-stranded-DNA-specific exonuclease
MEKTWILRSLPESPSDLAIVQEIQQKLSITPSLATMLWQRGVRDFDSAKDFFRPQIEDLHDPFLMKNMHSALERLKTALASGEKIMIYGDYDVDGTTSVALVYGFLSEFYDKLIYYNPDRYKEGYGISTLGIDTAAEEGVSLIIALDCGIKANDKVTYAKERHHIDFIICDHHEPGDEIPDAVAVLDPKQHDCPYPFKELTGNGVGFKLLTAWCLDQNIPLDRLFNYLDLAMVSIASDIVPIIGENRILAYFGLKKINENPCIGLQALKQVAGFTGEMTIENVVFVLGPRINAAGRIKHAKAAVQLLLSDNIEEALAFAYDIQAHNTERRTLDAGITGEALAMIGEDDWLLNIAKSTVLFNENWHKGVIGIVASRCIENYHRPTVIFTKTKDNMAAGSARSVPGFDLYQALDRCSHILEQFGGHMHAAGMTINIDRIDEFKTAFNDVVTEMILEEQLIPKIKIDVNLPLSEVDKKFYRIMKQMAPFGPKNMQPVFISDNVCLASTPKILKEKHLKLEIVDTESGTVFTALGFGMAENYFEKLAKAESFQMAYSLEINTFRDVSTLQLYARDFKFYD